jgi:hypothetical protein
MRLGLSVRYFADLPARDRSIVYATFSEDETYFRPRKRIAAAFAARGMSVDMRSAARAKIAVRLPDLPIMLRPIAAESYSLLLQTYLQTRKD